MFGPTALVEFVGVIATDQSFASKQQLLIEATPDCDYALALPHGAFDWGLRFLKEILKEVRALVCDAKARKKAGLVTFTDYKGYPKALGVSLSTVIMTKLGVTEPMAIGIATLVLLSLAQATHNAFCNVTNAQVVETIEARKRKR